MLVTRASRRGVLLRLLVAGVSGCGPGQGGEDEPPADDVAWLIDSFAQGCTSPITECLEAHYYEFVFSEDGTVQTYDIACGIRQPAEPTRRGRFRPTDEYGVVELLPPEGEESFAFTQTSIERGIVRRTGDCSIAEVDFDADGSYFVPIYRGTFFYKITDCISRAIYLNGPPNCSDPE